jgi:hypothetical protein
MLLKNFGSICENKIKSVDYHKFSSINLYFEDESRFGLFTRVGKSLTAKGVKPICQFQQVFQSTHLFGAFSPINGTHFVKNLGACTADNFQIFLNDFSLQNIEALKVMVLDNGAFQYAKKLIIPQNIMLIFCLPTVPNSIPQSVYGCLLSVIFQIFCLKLWMI